MDENQQLLLLDSNSDSPKHTAKPSYSEELLLELVDTANTTPGNPLFLSQTLPTSTFPGQMSLEHHSFFLYDTSEEEEEYFPPQATFRTPNILSCHSPFKSLIDKLQLALQRIKSKDRAKKMSYMVSRFGKTESYSKGMREQTNHSTIINQKKASFSELNKYMTQPSERKEELYKLKIAKYKAQRVITEEVEKKNPPSKIIKPEVSKYKELTTSISYGQASSKLAKPQAERQREKQGTASLTFMPTINAKSKQMMLKKGNVMPIYEREMRPKKAISQHLVIKPATPKSKI